MGSLREKIVQKLEDLSETSLEEVLDFVDFLAWRQMKLEEISCEQPRQKDLTKMVSTDRVVAAFEAAWNEPNESNKVFFPNARLDEEANIVNEWKSKIVVKTDNKYAETFKPELGDCSK